MPRPVDGEPGVEPASGTPSDGDATPEPGIVAPALPKPGKSPGVKPDDGLAEAGRKVLRFHLARMIARDPGTRSGKDPRDLHAMRVATRRMRAAWRVFGGAFQPHRTRKLEGALREVADRLGAVRDLDVLIDAGEQYAAGLGTPERAAVEPLFEAWRQDREAGRAALLRELESDRYRRFVHDFWAFVTDEGAGAAKRGPHEPRLVRDMAPARIWARYHAVRAYAPVLRGAEVETLHALRIDGRRLRYSLEFFRETLGREGSEVIARTVALQDHLGLLHDADVAAGLTRAFLERTTDLGVDERAEIGRYLVHREQEVTRLQHSIDPPWRRVEGVAFRQALGRALARL